MSISSAVSWPNASGTSCIWRDIGQMRQKLVGYKRRALSDHDLAETTARCRNDLLVDHVKNVLYYRRRYSGQLEPSVRCERLILTRTLEVRGHIQ